MRYSWPGNVRELQNVIHRTTIFSDETKIKADDIEFKTYELPGESSGGGDIEIQTVAEMEKALILKTLEKTANNKTKAADILGISSRTLRNKLKEYSLDDGED